MIDWSQWHEFWIGTKAGYQNGVNLRPPYYDYKKAVENLDKILHFKKTDNLLDVGCGNGQMIEQFVPYTTNISGIDYSENQVSLTEALVREKGVINGSYHVTPAHDLEMFESDTFDIVVCIAVLQYYNDLGMAQKAVSEMVRVLKKGGRLYLGDIFDKRRYTSVSTGDIAQTPEELGSGYDYREVPSFFESDKRFDLLITK